MKITESKLRKMIKEALNAILIDKKPIDGEELILSQLKKNSKFPWEVSESSKDNSGTSNFDAKIDDESFFRISITRGRYDDSPSFMLYPMLVYGDTGSAHDSEHFEDMSFKNESELLRYIMSIDKHVEKWMTSDIKDSNFLADLDKKK